MCDFEFVECPNCCHKAIELHDGDVFQCSYCGAELCECPGCGGECMVRVDYHMDDPSMAEVIQCPECDGWGLLVTGVMSDEPGE